jgi:5-formyltetrahydrofolate cyclo-ligase
VGDATTRGRGMKLPQGPAATGGVWEQLRRVARPDSRLHYDFAHMHPDFDGSEQAAARACVLTPVQKAAVVFCAPDGALVALREAILRAGKTLILSTYRMRRGFRMLDPARLAATDLAFAATLDGVERLGIPLALDALAALGSVDILATGAAAISKDGMRFGRSYQYFDIEWGLMAEMGLVREMTPIIAFVHDVQVVDDPIAASAREAVVDWIVTPTRSLHVAHRQRRPTGVDWPRIDAQEVEEMPALQDLQRAKGLRR